MKKASEKSKRKIIKKISILFRVGIESVYFIETNFFFIESTVNKSKN